MEAIVEPPTAPQATPAASARPAVVVAVVASAAAGLIHAAAAGAHSDISQLSALFAACAVAQLAWAALAWQRPQPPLFLLGLVLNGGALVVWGLSRSVGIGFIDGLEKGQSMGLQDGTTVAIEAIAVLALTVLLARPGPTSRTSSAGLRVALVTAALLLAAAGPAMAVPHEHHDDHGGLELATDGHTDSHGATPSSVPEAPVYPATFVHFLDDPSVTPAQRAAADDLLVTTTDAVKARFTDVASVEAAGYQSIGDEVTGWHHLVNYRYLLDGNEMDADHIESMVFKIKPDGTQQLASAMYILGPGKTMADVPDIAGQLTTWHDHQNLCWEGVHVVAVTDASGNCPIGEFRPTPPMLHVWLIDHECGPFAGIDGLHGSCAHAH